MVANGGGPRLASLARLGFTDLEGASERLDELAAETGLDVAEVLGCFERPVADADEALAQLLRLARRSRERLSALLADQDAGRRLTRVLGTSTGLADFLVRHPVELAALADTGPLPDAATLTADLLHAVGVPAHGVAAVAPDSGPWVATIGGAAGRRALRIRYRRRLLQIAAWDLAQPSGLAVVEQVAAALADLAAAALEAALAVARVDLAAGPAGASAAAAVAATRLAVIGMGKAGARELNYVSDVDVIFVAERDAAPTDDPYASAVPTDILPIATRLAAGMMRVIDETDVEPALWQVDANLRPEGKDGALVRTLESHVAYYGRWAKGWEFQALLKARPLAGDPALGERYLAAIGPLVWQVTAQPDFVQSVQRMRERVVEHIPAGEAERQLKLGPGGLRDIEFTVQLLQLVHGRTDDGLHQRATLPALRALAEGGYIGRVEAAEFSEDYRLLRLLEHRLQLRGLRRTHLMPVDDAAVRVLARSTGLGIGAADLRERWIRVRGRVRTLHERLFYRPLLGAVARLSEEDVALTSAAASARLSGVGFRDPRGALAHIAALTGGVSRKAAIQRTLLPVLLQWFAEGPDPDLGLLAFRRLSEQLGDASWYLRMLRDAPEAARRLSIVLTTSRFVTDLLDRYPESIAWLANDDDLQPRSDAVLLAETDAILARHPHPDDAAAALRTARRREVLRLAFASLVGEISVERLGHALASVTTALLAGAVRVATRAPGDWPDFAVIAMGRYGGGELGFGSDADAICVYRAQADVRSEVSQRRAEVLVAEIIRLTQDARLPFDLDLDLRPEGRSGAVVRSLGSYAAYYSRWSLTWESQALLRAHGVAGDAALQAEFMALADRYRYPKRLGAGAIREIRRIKARIETERLPRGADPSRHLKLGRGSLSDVEWLVQLLQLQHAARIPALRTTNTLEGLEAAVAAKLIPRPDADQLRDAWILASRVRSALTLWTSRTTDLLPTDWTQLEGVARILEYPPGSATVLEDTYLRTTRLSRAVYERRFTDPSST